MTMKMDLAPPFHLQVAPLLSSLSVELGIWKYEEIPVSQAVSQPLPLPKCYLTVLQYLTHALTDEHTHRQTASQSYGQTLFTAGIVYGRNNTTSSTLT